MRHTTRWFTFVCSVSLFLASLTANGFSANPHCSDVGGAILTNVGGFGFIDQHLTTLGVATGDLRGAIGVEITNVNSTSTIFSVKHHWVTDNGETLNIDPAEAHGAFVGPGLLAITDYKVHLSGDTGRFADATGDMKAIGELDFSTGQVVLRYSGQVCRHDNDERNGH